MNDDSYSVDEAEVERSRAKPEAQRTGYDKALIGVDDAIETARVALTNAGFKLQHLILIYDATETPDKNEQTQANVGLVGYPHHPDCMMKLLVGAMSSIAPEAGGFAIPIPAELLDDDGPSQDGPIHHQ